MKLLFFLLLFATIFGYEQPLHVTDEKWASVLPHLLPEDHPIKEKLDRFFAKCSYRVLENKMYVRLSGFNVIRYNEKTGVYILSHPKFKGYIIKLYTDDCANTDETHFWLKRIRGVETIQRLISYFDVGDQFKVPVKWIYPVPQPTVENGKCFILICEDMKLVPAHMNRIVWRSGRITDELLNNLWLLLTHGGLVDSCYITNIPFSQDGKIAFVDTEHNLELPVNYNALIPSLSPRMSEYWTRLLQSGGP